MGPAPSAAEVCEPIRFGLNSAAQTIQLFGAILIPLIAVVVIAAVSRRYPTHTLRWTSRRIAVLLGNRFVAPFGLVVLAAGVAFYGAAILAAAPSAGQCQQPVAVLGAVGLLLTLVGAMTAAAAEAVGRQLGWVLLAAFFALDVWIVFGMVMMLAESDPRAPDPMLLLAFVMHGLCMFLTMVWAFHARDLSTMAQVRADEAGRSIGAVWIFLAAYIVVGFSQQERSPFDSTAGGAVLSALTLSALALTMGSGYTKYREVMDQERPTVGGLAPTTPEEAAAAGDVRLRPRRSQAR